MPRMIAVLAAMAGLVVGQHPARAAEPAPTAPAVTTSAAVTAIRAFSSDFEDGGSADWSSVTFTAGVKRQFVPAFSAALSFAYESQDWNFGPTENFAGAAPWGGLQRPGLGLGLNLALSRSLLVGVSPSAEWPAAEGVSGSDALTYGATVSALHVFSPRFVLGGGAKVYRQFYGVKVSPFVIVNWQLTDRLRIANAIPSGPEGGAGVELRYAPGERWEFAGGGVWRSDRWRLGNRGPFAGEIVETSFIPLLARCTRSLDPKTRLDVYGGALFGGSLKVKDSDGRALAMDTFAPAPAVALTLSRKF